MPSAIGLNIIGSTVLDDQTVSNVASVQFTKFTSNYSKYIWLFQDIIPETDFRNTAIRTSSDGGSSYDSGASDYAYCGRGIRDDADLTNRQDPDSTNILTNINGVGGASAGFSDEGFSGYAIIYDPLDARYTNIFFESIYRNSFNNTYYCFGGGSRRSTTPVNAIEFLMDSGNVSGRFVMLGVTR